MEPVTLAWLLSEPGQELLAAAVATVAREADPLRRGAALRRTPAGAGATPDQCAAALTQADLRVRARAKYAADADRMYLTPDGLEQASRAEVAAHRADRVAAAGPSSVADLGCGVGGDLIALARAGLTPTGVDADPLRVALARANLAALGLPGRVEEADVTTLPLDPYDVVFCDPARRGPAGRTHRPGDWSPSWDFVATLFARDACVKLAPGIDHALLPPCAEAEWVSLHGEVKEAVVWSGALAGVRRRATVLGDTGRHCLTDRDDPGPADGEGGPGGPVGGYLYEPDGAVIRAGLVTAVAARVGGRLLDRRIAYVTADAHVPTPFARAYRVLEELPHRTKALRRALRERGIGRLTIKKRGVEVDPAVLRRELSPRGDAEGTVVLARRGRGVLCLLVQPVG